MDIKNAVILVTGANRGIGKAYAEEFLKAGAKKIYLGSRKPEAVQDMVKAHPDKYVALPLDITDADQIKASARAAKDVNVLINNAGILFLDGLEDKDAADNARKQFEVNYIGPLLMTQAFAPVLKSNGGGTVITVSSIAGHVVFPGFMTYAASKFAAHSLILSMRLDLAAQGTKVIGVYPGPIETDMTKNIHFDKVPASQVPQETLKAIAEGREDVFTDPMAKDLYQALRDDPKQVEKNMLQMIQEAA